MKDIKDSNFSFRLPSTLKIELFKRATELSIQPGDYIIKLIKKDIASKLSELDKKERSEILSKIDEELNKFLSFFVEHMHKTLLHIDDKVKYISLASDQILSESVQSSERVKEVINGIYKNDSLRIIEDTNKKIVSKISVIKENILRNKNQNS